MTGTLVLFDDRTAAGWMPFALTRPAGELLFGALTMADRAEAIFGIPCVGHIASPRLHGFGAPEGRPVREPTAFDATQPRLFLSSRLVPEWGGKLTLPGTPALLRVGGEAAGWYAPPGAPAPPRAFFDDPANGAAQASVELDVPGRMLRDVWQLVTGNSAQILQDWAGSLRRSRATPSAGDAAWQITGGSAELLRVEPGSVVEPHVVFDVTHGPIVIGAEVTIRAFTRIAGPACIGAGTTVLGGSLSEVSIGPACKVRGEVEASVLLGYDNKAHDGFLGHAYVGRWVNLGALTTNSDLKNNYGTVRLWTPAGEVDTNEAKIGCFIGDHVKTAIGTFIGTGTVIGAGSNVFGARPPRLVVPFAWGSDGITPYGLDRFLTTAARVMQRRGVQLSAGVREVLGRAWQESWSAPARNRE